MSLDSRKELSIALQTLTDSHRGILAQVERSNQRVECSLESRIKTIDALLHEWKADLVHIWIPMVAAASVLIGLFGGIEIQSCPDVPPTASMPSTSVPGPATASPEPQTSAVPDSSLKQPDSNRVNGKANRAHK